MLKSQQFMPDKYGLKFNPFNAGATYAPESQDVYSPEMYGHQHIEFRQKFFLEPLVSGQPIIGAIWSSGLRTDPESRGYGKSTMMGEETKMLNKDFGLSIFQELGEAKEDAAECPVLAGYVSFNTTAINSIEAAGYHLVKSMVRDGTEKGGSTHGRLRKMLIKRLANDEKVQKGDESAAIERAVRERVRQLGIQVEFRGELEHFLQMLSGGNVEALADYLANVNSWHHIRAGVKFLQVYTCFANLAGIKHVTYFIDQVEDFTSTSSRAKIMKNVKVIRDALLESEPFASSASFVFQLHPVAWASLRTAWEHENLRDLGTESKQSEPYVVNLKGLTTFELAMECATTYLNHPKFAVPGRPAESITPFTEEAIRYAWENTDRVPRRFIRAMSDLIEHGRKNKIETIDEECAMSVLDASQDFVTETKPPKRRAKANELDSRLA